VSKEEEDVSISNEEDENMLWEQCFVITNLLNITRYITHHESTTNDMFQYQHRYYMDLPRNLVIENKKITIYPTNMVVDINEGTFKVEQKTMNVHEHLNQGTSSTNNMLSLLHLHPKRTNNRKILINYSQSHVVSSNQYLSIM
jgi:hypothetical protein